MALVHDVGSVSLPGQTQTIRSPFCGISSLGPPYLPLHPPYRSHSHLPAPRSTFQKTKPPISPPRPSRPLHPHRQPLLQDLSRCQRSSLDPDRACLASRPLCAAPRLKSRGPLSAVWRDLTLLVISLLLLQISARRVSLAAGRVYLSHHLCARLPSRSIPSRELPRWSQT